MRLGQVVVDFVPCETLAADAQLHVRGFDSLVHTCFDIPAFQRALPVRRAQLQRLAAVRPTKARLQGHSVQVARVRLFGLLVPATSVPQVVVAEF